MDFATQYGRSCIVTGISLKDASQHSCSHNTLSSILLSDLHGIMVDIIQFISSSSDGAVHNAIQQAFGAEKQCFTDILVKVQSQLEHC